MRLWRLFFLAAGLLNVLGGTAGLLTFERQLASQGMPAPNYPFAFQLLFLLVVTLGVGYLMVARDPHRNRGVVWIGLLTKAMGVVMSFWAIHDGQMAASSWWQPLVVDLPWAVGFALYLVRVPAGEEAAHASRS